LDILHQTRHANRTDTNPEAQWVNFAPPFSPNRLYTGFVY
jgi:hypothetical protein